VVEIHDSVHLGGRNTAPAEPAQTVAAVVSEPAGGREFADLLASLVDDSVDLTGPTSPLDATRAAVPSVAPTNGTPPAVATARRPLATPPSLRLSTVAPPAITPTVAPPTVAAPASLARPLARPLALPVVEPTLAAPATAPLQREPVIDIPDRRDVGSPDLRDDDSSDINMGLIDLAAMHRTVSASFRPAPSIADHGIVAIIGARRDAFTAAIGVAELLGRSASDVLVLEPDNDDIDEGPSPEELVAIVQSAARQRERLGATGPTIAVVVVAPGIEGHRWATSALAGLHADQVRLAVAGWRPLARLPETIVGLGGVDVIDVVDLQSAGDAAAFLDLDTPIGTVDGDVATPGGWVAALAALGQPMTRRDAGIGWHETANR